MVQFELPAFMNHCHTDVSNFKGKDSINKVESLILTAIELGLKGVSITDHETISNHIRAIKFIKKLKENGQLPNDFKVGLGNEIYLVDREEEREIQERKERVEYYHLILVARNKRGYDGIKLLSAHAWDNYHWYRGYERVPTYKDYFFEIMKDYGKDIICTTACLGGELAKSLHDGNKERAFKFVLDLKSIFGDNLYIELQPSYAEEQIEFNEQAYKIAKFYGIKPIVATDAHYLRPEDRDFHRNYLQSQNSDREVDSFYASTYLMSSSEIQEYFAYLDSTELIENTMEIHSKIEFYDFEQEQKIPKSKYSMNAQPTHMFREYYNKYKYLGMFGSSLNQEDKYFLAEIEKGFIQKHQEMNETNIARIDLEMMEIWKISEKMGQKMSSYYTLTKELIDLIWLVSYVGVSRGSSSGYYTAYLLDIVQLNPIEFGIPHWRHLHHSRPDMPDIDIDSQSSKREAIMDLVRKNYGVNNVVNCCTFTTEKAKSSILTASRGIGLDHDISQHIANMITDSSLTLKECFYGNSEKGIKPIVGLKEELQKHKGLFEAVTKYEGLISGRSQHASGVFIIDDGILSSNCTMRTSTGKLITQFNYDDSVYCGCMKLDFLSINALERIRTCMDLLEEDKEITNQGSLRETYKKYLHPDVLDWDNKRMFDMLIEGVVDDAFQYDTSQGKNAIKVLEPDTFDILVQGNTLMRLSCEGEQPIEKCAKFKKDISLWYDELKEYELNEEEIRILEKHLLHKFGVADTQECVMELSMDKGISAFDIVKANKLRKAIAKANAEELIKQTQSSFFEAGLSVGNRINILSYVWDKCITPMLGYAFSIAHVMPYTTILMQEMNLCYFHNPIYWKTACLLVNSGIIEGEISGGVDYGTIAKAMSKIKDIITAPDINKSAIGFTPHAEQNQILFGLASINGIGKNEIEMIFNTRPFSNFDDFIQRSGFTTKKTISLIKSGCFDNLTNLSRKDLLVAYISKYVIPTREKLTSTHVDKLEQWFMENHMVDYKMHVFHKDVKNRKSDGFYNVPVLYENFVLNKFENYHYSDNGDFICVPVKDYNKFIKPYQERLKEILNNECLEVFTNLERRAFWIENCLGTEETWEMESTSFYHDRHELDNYVLDNFNISNFFEMNSKTEKVEVTKRGKTFNKIVMYTIAGTVIDKNKAKKRFTILTQTGAVDIKLTEGQYLAYSKKVVDIKGKNKTVLDDSWLNRGTKLIITGYRNGDYFKAKAIDSSQPMIYKIVGQQPDKQPLVTFNKL